MSLISTSMKLPSVSTVHRTLSTSSAAAMIEDDDLTLSRHHRPLCLDTLRRHVFTEKPYLHYDPRSNGLRIARGEAPREGLLLCSPNWSSVSDGASETPVIGLCRAVDTLERR